MNIVRGLRCSLKSQIIFAFLQTVFVWSFYRIYIADSGSTVRITEPKKQQFNVLNGSKVNKHDYQLTIEASDFCQRHPIKISILVGVLSHPAHHERRRFLRQRLAPFEKNGIYPIFVLGTPEDPNLRRQIVMESDVYKDIIQEDFEDNYRNLVLKTIMLMKWVSQNCELASFLVRVDDDMFFNPDNVISIVDGLLQRNINCRTLMCHYVEIEDAYSTGLALQNESVQIIKIKSEDYSMSEPSVVLKSTIFAHEPDKMMYSNLWDEFGHPSFKLGRNPELFEKYLKETKPMNCTNTNSWNKQ